jgi:hypothetical protein
MRMKLFISNEELGWIVKEYCKLPSDAIITEAPNGIYLETEVSRMPLTIKFNTIEKSEKNLTKENFSDFLVDLLSEKY